MTRVQPDSTFFDTSVELFVFYDNREDFYLRYFQIKLSYFKEKTNLFSKQYCFDSIFIFSKKHKFL